MRILMFFSALFFAVLSLAYKGARAVLWSHAVVLWALGGDVLMVLWVGQAWAQRSQRTQLPQASEEARADPS